MRSSNLILCILPLLASVVSADPWAKYTSNQLAYTTCSTYITANAALCNGTGYKCYCKTPAALASIAGCYINYFDNSTTKINWFLNLCQEEANVTLTDEGFYAAYDNATNGNYFIDPSTIDGFNKTEISYSPIVTKPLIVANYWNSLTARFMNYNKSIYFGTAMIASWAFIMVFCGIVNWILYFSPNLANNWFMKLWKKNITYPATGRKTKDVDKSFLFLFRFLIPDRFETLCIILFMAMWIGFIANGMHHVKNDTVWKSQEAEVGRYVADRSGITSLFLVPLVVLFSGRNNFMQWVTRWSYARMLTFHRWVARFLVLTIFIHAVSMSCSGIGLGKFTSRYEKPYVRWGAVAMCCLGLILFQSMLFFRRKSYEAFFLIHFFLSLFFLIGSWIHLRENGYANWLYAAVAVYAFERFCRAFRLLCFGAPVANIELKADETLKVTVPRPAYWTSSPGQHAFIYFWKPLTFWQSHPFTIVDSVDGGNNITFYVKIKGGITNSLYKSLASSPTKSSEIRVSVEGPYGMGLPLQRYNNVVLMAGGNGVPGLFAEAMDLVKRNLPNQRVSFYWVIRHWKSLDWFYTELAKFENTNIKPIVYVTQPQMMEGLVLPNGSSESETDEDEKSETKDHTTAANPDVIAKLKNYLSYVEFREGRPETQLIVTEEINTAQGSIAFVACAHVNMVDDIRKVVANEVTNSEHEIDFFDQIQVW